MSNCILSSMPDDQSVNWGQLKELHLENCCLPIKNILPSTPSLESLELSAQILCSIIASKSLKKLVLNDIMSWHLQISCPNLEELKLFGDFYDMSAPKVMNWPSLVRATLNFKGCDKFVGSTVKIIEQLQHVKELKFGSQTLSYLSKNRVAPSSVLLNNKSLTLDITDFEKHSNGIAWALRTSHILEKLVIKLYKSESTPNLPDVSTENYWSSNKIVLFNYFVSHLKTVEGFSDSDNRRKTVLDFVEFLLKNARVLECWRSWF